MQSYANFSDLVREFFCKSLGGVSHNMYGDSQHDARNSKDARMREQGAIRNELTLLYQDVDRLGVRVESLDRHFNQAAKDI